MVHIAFSPPALAASIVFIENWGGPQALEGRVGLIEPSAFTKVSALGIEEQRVNVIVDLLDLGTTLGDGYRVEGRGVVWEATDAFRVPISALKPRIHQLVLISAENFSPMRKYSQLS